MTYFDGLLNSYSRLVALKWPDNLAPSQRVWMAVYPPEIERNLRLRHLEFQIATAKTGHEWRLIDITSDFEHWMAANEYRDSYFESPELLAGSLSDFHQALVTRVSTTLRECNERTVVGLLGAGSLFGLGGEIKVSALINDVADDLAGRLLVFFPGQHDGNNYRLLDARDGWNYLATAITADSVGS